MNRLAAAATVLVLVAGCAARTVAAPEPAPVLVLNEQLPNDARICVARNPWHDARLTCISAAALRALLRHQQDVALEVRR